MWYTIETRLYTRGRFSIYKITYIFSTGNSSPYHLYNNNYDCWLLSKTSAPPVVVFLVNGFILLCFNVWQSSFVRIACSVFIFYYGTCHLVYFVFVCPFMETLVPFVYLLQSSSIHAFTCTYVLSTYLSQVHPSVVGGNYR